MTGTNDGHRYSIDTVQYGVGEVVFKTKLENLETLFAAINVNIVPVSVPHSYSTRIVCGMFVPFSQCQTQLNLISFYYYYCLLPFAINNGVEYTIPINSSK